MSILVTDIFERRLIVLFVDGRMDPLRGWIKALNPKADIKKSNNMDPGTIKRKALPKELSKPKDQENLPFSKDAPRRYKLDEETQKVRRKMCFTCKEP